MGGVGGWASFLSVWLPEVPCFLAGGPASKIKGRRADKSQSLSSHHPRSLPPSVTSKGTGDRSRPTWGTRVILLLSGELINNFSSICPLIPSSLKGDMFTGPRIRETFKSAPQGPPFML